MLADFQDLAYYKKQYFALETALLSKGGKFLICSCREEQDLFCSCY